MFSAGGVQNLNIGEYLLYSFFVHPPPNFIGFFDNGPEKTILLLDEKIYAYFY